LTKWLKYAKIALITFIKGEGEMVQVFCRREKPNEQPYLSRYEVSLPRFLWMFFGGIGNLSYNIRLLGSDRIVLESPDYSIVKDTFEIDATEEEMTRIVATYWFFMQAYCSAENKKNNANKLRIRLFYTRFKDFCPQTIYPEYSNGAFLPLDDLRRVIALMEDINDENDIMALCDIVMIPAMEDVVLAIEEWNKASRSVPLHELLS